MAALVLVLMLACLSACGLVAHGTSQRIVCITRPAGALIKMADGTTCTTPCSLTLRRKKDETLTIEREGYETMTLPVRSTLSKSSAENLLLPAGLVCWGIDVASGGAYQLVPEQVDVMLTPAEPPGP